MNGVGKNILIHCYTQAFRKRVFYRSVRLHSEYSNEKSNLRK